ncbi:unnamed protein product [Triticum turgidum subsp. durum]|uniref:Uncharacterized protein n=1 Tax=Triticum turgidum subsp. durum TaxID=4567 RepID=A0A9R0R9V4_TRITD|nr:unnamed protein product [Triticum turgidum subsp. durum]
MAMSILGALKLAPSQPATTAQPTPGRAPSSLHFHLANAGAAALVAASLLLADPALAFRVSSTVFAPVDRVWWRGD